MDHFTISQAIIGGWFYCQGRYCQTITSGWGQG